MCAEVLAIKVRKPVLLQPFTRERCLKRGSVAEITGQAGGAEPGAGTGVWPCTLTTGRAGAPRDLPEPCFSVVAVLSEGVGALTGTEMHIHHVSTLACSVPVSTAGTRVVSKVFLQLVVCMHLPGFHSCLQVSIFRPSICCLTLCRKCSLDV